MPTTGQIPEFVKTLWMLCLGRTPSSADLEHVVRGLSNGDDPIDYVASIYNCDEAVLFRNRATKVKEFFPAGHYYSPVVDPNALRNSSFAATLESDHLLGLEIDFAKMVGTFDQLKTQVSDISFPPTKHSGYRYYADNGMFPMGDAVILAAMIRMHRPRRIIEVGSGFSSAAMLDTIDRTDGLDTELTLIEPNPERLEALLKNSDRSRIKIIRSNVQEVPISQFEELDVNDVLFLDTTHISKTGSDVNFELFHVLPILKPGVLVHLHDIFDRFEYPEAWIYGENRSWNELYMVRAFLMYNDKFEIQFANHAFITKYEAMVRGAFLHIGNYEASGLWLKVLSNSI